MRIFLDIETIPTQRDDLRAWVGSKVTPPASIKNPETLAKWHAEDRPSGRGACRGRPSAASVRHPMRTPQ